MSCNKEFIEWLKLEEANSGSQILADDETNVTETKKIRLKKKI